MKVLIFGSRNVTNKELCTLVLNKVCTLNPDIKSAVVNKQITFVHGNARGADLTFAEIVTQAGYPVEVYRADWNNLSAKPCKIKADRYGVYNALAGHNRNSLMISKVDYAIGVWDEVSKGTEDSINKLKAAGLPFSVFNMSGVMMEL